MADAELNVNDAETLQSRTLQVVELKSRENLYAVCGV